MNAIHQSQLRNGRPSDKSDVAKNGRFTDVSRNAKEGLESLLWDITMIVNNMVMSVLHLRVEFFERSVQDRISGGIYQLIVR